MIIPVSVKNQSIDSSGITSDYKAAISEYIWNGFEANAKKVSIEYTLNEAFGVKELIIKDNGDGINYDELGETFGAFLASKKNLLSLQIKSKANKGKGRFSFIAFSSNAEWHTVYKDNNVYKEYDINMSSDKKEVIDCSEPQLSDRQETGTEVKFTNINTLTAENMGFEIIEPALLKDFAWFLYLYKNKNVEIVVNDEKIDYEKYINTELSEKSMVTIEGYRFEINLVVWQESISEKFCCYYFDEENIVVELKAPRVLLTKKVLRQVEDYMDYVRRQPQFNSELRKWKFIAVCKEVDDYVKSQYKAFEDKGKVGLVFQVDNCEVYALTWDDIFKSFEIKHKPMLERLKYDRERVANELMAEVSDTEGREKADTLTKIAVAKVL